METIVTVSNFEKCLMKKLATAYKNSKLCDMAIKCPNGNLEAHSLVVGAYIPVFKKQQFNEVIVHRSKFSKECMECILDIIYFGTKNIPTNLVDELIKAFEWYRIEDLEIKILKLTPTNPEGTVISQANSTMIKEESDDTSISETDDDDKALKRPTCDSSDEEQYAKAPKIEPLNCVKKEDLDTSQFEESYSDIRAARMELYCMKKEDPDRSEFPEPCSSNIVSLDNRAPKIEPLDCVKKEDPDRCQFEEPYSSNIGSQDIRAAGMELGCVKKEDPDRSEFGEPCSSNIVPRDNRAAEMALDCMKNEDPDRSEFEVPCSSNIVPRDNRDCEKASSSSSDCDGDSISDAPSKSILNLISKMNRKAALHVCVVCMEECTNIVEHRKRHQNKRKKEVCNCGKKFFIEFFITHHKCK